MAGLSVFLVALSGFALVVALGVDETVLRAYRITA